MEVYARETSSFRDDEDCPGLRRVAWGERGTNASEGIDLMKKLLIVGVVAILGALSLGAAAGITVNGGNVGSGNGVVGGYIVTGTTWTTDGNGDVTGVDFTLDNVAASVDVQTTTTGGGGGPAPLAGGGTDSFLNWVCTGTPGTSISCTTTGTPGTAVAAATLDGLTVVASS